VIEGEKLRVTHFARSHRKFAMGGPRYIAGDRYIVGLVGQNEPGRGIAAHQSGENRGIGGIATNHSMSAEPEHVCR
jgi:hypothetical protein